MKTLKICVTTVLLLSGLPETRADFVTVSLAPVANEIQLRIQNPPVGLQTLGAVPFNIPASGNNSWSSDVGTTPGVQSTSSMVLPVNVFGATAVDTLINTGWGVDGSLTVTATFLGTGGANYSLALKEGTDIRDWLDNTTTPFSNTINGTTTTQVFSGVPNAAGGSLGRIDKQHIALPVSFASQTLMQIILTDNGVTGNNDGTFSHNVGAQRSFIYGVTLTVVPEPPSFILLCVGGMLLGWQRVRE